jgi:Na+-translocating ferredoxin:NAD+ oxidoreductase subunit E
MKAARKIFTDINRNNPAALLILGICPALAVTTNVKSAIAMGLATTFVLLFSNLMISLLRKRITYNIKIFAFFIITAAFTTIADLLLQAFFPELSKALGIYVPLIAVNGLVLQRGEYFALKKNFLSSLLDGIYVGILFTVTIIIAAAIREMLGNGSVMEYRILSDQAKTLLFITLPAGAFIILGFLIAVFQKPFNKTSK